MTAYAPVCAKRIGFVSDGLWTYLSCCRKTKPRKAMKKIGIVGGVAWLSTVDYYSGLCRRSEQWHLARNLQGVPSTPEMSIESLDLNKAISYLGIDDIEESWSQFDEYHRAALRRLEASGAEFA